MVTYPPHRIDQLKVKLGRVGHGDMVIGSLAVTNIGFSALPWESVGPPLTNADLQAEITIIGAGPDMPFVPAFGPKGQMIISRIGSVTSPNSCTINFAAQNNTQPGAANVTVYRPVDYRYDSIRLEKSLTSITRSSLYFEIQSRHGEMVCIEGMPVLLEDEFLGDLWGGSIDTVEMVNETGTLGDPITFKVTCVSWASLLERRPINPYVLNGGNFTAQTLKSICEHLVYDYCDSEGLSVNATTGPTIDLNLAGNADKSVADGLNEACSKSSNPSETYIWEVGPWKSVNVYRAEITPAPWGINDADGSDNSILVKVNYRRTRSKMANGVYLWCTAVLRDTPDETYSGDGTDTGFSTTKPIGITPEITVAGVAKTVGLANAAITYDWYWSPGSPSLTAAVAPALGATIVVKYKAQSAELFNGLNTDAIDKQLRIEGGTGQWFTRMQYDLPIRAEDCPLLALSFADKLAQIPKELTVVTHRPYLNIGQTIPIALAQFALASALYLIERIVMTTEGGYFKWEVQCVNGPSIGDYLTAFGVMAVGGTGNVTAGGFGGGSGTGEPGGSGVTVVELDIVASGTISGPDPNVGGLLVLYIAINGVGGFNVEFDPAVFRWPPYIDTTPNLAVTAIFASVEGKWTYVPVNGRMP